FNPSHRHRKRIPGVCGLTHDPDNHPPTPRILTGVTAMATNGTAITMKSGRLQVPDDPILPFIEGDGTGPDIWRASVRVFDAAVNKAYGGRRKIAWKEVLAGEKAFKVTNNWLPDETVAAFQQYL